MIRGSELFLLTFGMNVSDNVRVGTTTILSAVIAACTVGKFCKVRNRIDVKIKFRKMTITIAFIYFESFRTSTVILRMQRASTNVMNCTVP